VLLIRTRGRLSISGTELSFTDEKGRWYSISIVYGTRDHAMLVARAEAEEQNEGYRT